MHKSLRGRRSAAVAQACGDAVDGEVDAFGDARIGLTGAATADEIDLQLVERIDIGQA